jgi:hypothetical protein
VAVWGQFPSGGRSNKSRERTLRAQLANGCHGCDIPWNHRHDSLTFQQHLVAGGTPVYFFLDGEGGGGCLGGAGASAAARSRLSMAHDRGYLFLCYSSMLTFSEMPAALFGVAWLAEGAACSLS